MIELSLESQHETNIAKLVNEFGQDKELEIDKLYRKECELLKKEAKITTFVPLLAYKHTRDILRIEYDPSFSEKQVRKYEKHHNP